MGRWKTHSLVDDDLGLETLVLGPQGGEDAFDLADPSERHPFVVVADDDARRDRDPLDVGRHGNERLPQIERRYISTT